MTESTRPMKEEKWLELAISNAEAGAWFWDLSLKGKEIVRTESYNRIFGLDPEQLWTRDDLIRCIHPMERERTWIKIQSVMNGTVPEYEAEYRIIRKDGSIRWVRAIGKGMRDSSGKTTAVAGLLRDITEFKNVQRDRDLMIDTLSHDLRNPLAAAHANAELIQRYPDLKEGRPKILERIIVAIERADRIIQDLLDSSHARSGQAMRLTFRACDLSQVLREAVEDLSSQYGHRFRFESRGSFQGTWACDGLRRVLENLATNAIKYGAAHEPIRIELRRETERVLLSVHNEGAPIPGEEQGKLFEPFFRAANSEASTLPGWGLGLTIVRLVSEALHGRVTLESGPGVGTTFRLVFPAEAIRLAG
jgi:PAS domain S-box-containing protein